MHLTIRKVDYHTGNYVTPEGGGGVLPKKMGMGVRPASQNPYPIYE